MISVRKRRRTRFWPWQLWCPNCGWALPIVGGTVIVAVLMVVGWTIILFNWWWYGILPDAAP